MSERFRAIAVLVGVAVMSVAACTGGEDDGPMADEAPEPLPTVASDGPLLCDFVPADSVQVALGRDEVSERGELRHAPAGMPSSGTCDVFVEGADQAVFSVTVVFGESQYTDETRSRLETDEFEYLFPADVGEGYAFRRPGPVADGSRDGAGAALVVGDGEFTLIAGLNDHAEGRDPLDDLVAIVQQIAGVLESVAAST